MLFGGSCQTPDSRRSSFNCGYTAASNDRARGPQQDRDARESIPIAGERDLVAERGTYREEGLTNLGVARLGSLRLR
jgi:hypothetical protein